MGNMTAEDAEEDDEGVVKRPYSRHVPGVRSQQ